MIRSAIVVPSYNRPAQLAGCLAALVGQDDESFEVVVVDDGSPQPLSRICTPYGDRVRCIRQENAGPGSARNRGAAETEATFLAFTDDDCRPQRDWLRALRSAHAGQENRLVGGRVENGLPFNYYASGSQAIVDYLYHYFDASAGRMPFFTTNNIGCSRAAFLHIGGFDESFERAAAEDRDFGIRWREGGGHLTYTGGAIVNHFHAMTLHQFWRQHTDYGAGAYQLHRAMKSRGSDLPRMERLSFYSGLGLWPICRMGPRGFGLSILIVLSQVAMASGYYQAARQHRFPRRLDAAGRFLVCSL